MKTNSTLISPSGQLLFHSNRVSLDRGLFAHNENALNDTLSLINITGSLKSTKYWMQWTPKLSLVIRTAVAPHEHNVLRYPLYSSYWCDRWTLRPQPAALNRISLYYQVRSQSHLLCNSNVEHVVASTSRLCTLNAQITHHIFQ